MMRKESCMNRDARKALVIGCGIAGPAVALFLQRAGIEAEIYEARAESTDYGGLFLNTACNGLSVLGTLGLDEQVSRQGSPIPRMMIWSGNGKRLGEVRNGARAEGAFLVGCDGVHSRTRQLIHPDAPAPHYTGLMSAGGFAPHSSFAPTPDTMHFIFGKRAFFGYHISSSGELYWFVNCSQKEAPARGEVDMIVSDAWQERLLDLFRGDLPLIFELIRATQSTIIGYPIYDIVTQPTWHQGPVVLVGDAIHAVSPQAGQGASLAVEDAMVLAKCLRDSEDHALAFATYEQPPSSTRRAYGPVWTQPESAEGHEQSDPGGISGQAHAVVPEALCQPCRTRLGLLLPG